MGDEKEAAQHDAGTVENNCRFQGIAPGITGKMIHPEQWRFP